MARISGGGWMMPTAWVWVSSLIAVPPSTFTERSVRFWIEWELRDDPVGVRWLVGVSGWDLGWVPVFHNGTGQHDRAAVDGEGTHHIHHLRGGLGYLHPGRPAHRR
jgi:hypothetical protein